jgi:ferredoxin--NADP+ reductase
MMHLSLFLSTVALLTVSTAAFVPQQAVWTAPPPRTTLFQASGSTNELMKKCGAGLAFVPVGKKQLFDPDLEGKLQGTHDLDNRIRLGVTYQPPNLSAAAATATSAVVPDANVPLKDTQHWLEDIGIPAAFAKASAPVTATILGRTKIIGDSAPGDIEHVVMQLPAGMHYVEGQSLSVIPPGLNDKGKPNKPRLYSIASTRYGDLLDGSTVSLCVRRAEFWDSETGANDPEKAGVCSKFLCDCVAGDTIQVAGPVGKTMLLPEDPSADIIMVATGTGIAPFRAFLHRLFMEQTVARHVYTGDAWMILGVPVTSGLLYQEELQAMQENAAREGTATLTVDYAISREMKNQAGGKLYVQDALQNKADILWDKLDGGAHIYFCGLKGMMPGILSALEEVATARGVDWSVKLKELQANKQWHVEVY